MSDPTIYSILKSNLLIEDTKSHFQNLQPNKVIDVREGKSSNARDMHMMFSFLDEELLKF